LALILFAITLFVSAFLLFLVQPMIGKMILPKLGGTPQVWNTCMVFFQTALLVGYGYTHSVSTFLKTRTQVMLHCGVLFVPFLVLLPWMPFNVTEWIPPPGINPIPATLWLLAQVVGIPFIVVATSAPLLQKWFGSTGHPAAKDPYFLYGASNLGSMLALVAYPVLVEPFFRLNPFNPSDPNAPHVFDIMRQPWLWTAGYVLLVALILCCAAMVLMSPPSVQLKTAGGKSLSDSAGAAAAASAPAPTTSAPAEGITAAAPAPAPAASTEPPPPVGDMPAPVPPPDAPAPAPPAPAPAAASTAVTTAPSKPNPATSFKKGSKQHKKGGKHKHQHHQAPAQQQQQQQPAVKSTAVSTTPLAPAPSAPSLTAPTTTTPVTHHAPVHDPDAITPFRRFRWVLLAAVPSSLMLGVTTYMSTDISAIAMFWILPLSLYLLSFIFVFMRWPINWIEQAHRPMLFIQPPLLGFLALITVTGASQFAIGGIIGVIAINLLAFFATALVCHGELAKDRPSTRHLTEFYLWMSVGGMLGGMFNGLLAPIAFKGVYEFGMAILVACLVRPRMMDVGWTEQLIQMFTQADGGAAPAKKPHPHHGHRTVAPRKLVHTDANPNVSYAVDVIMPLLVIGVLSALLWGRTANWLAETFRARDLAGALTIVVLIPVVMACLSFGRPLRFGLAIGGILLIGAMWRGGDRQALVHERSYFGVIQVYPGTERVTDGSKSYDYSYRHLMHGTTDHGMNFRKPERTDKDTEDFSRLATTYYHRLGPVGIGMEKFNWFGHTATRTRDEKTGAITYTISVDYAKTFNKYPGDARLTASVVGGLAGDLAGGFGMPLTAVLQTQSEPPYATIGLGTGTMASYARPFQTVHFYEIDDTIKRLSLPPRGGTVWFNYLDEALKRGGNVNVLMGDARLRMAQPWDWKKSKDPTHQSFDADQLWKDLGLDKLTPKDSAYQDKFNEYFEKVHEKRGGPDNYYHLIVVDAFSSDAIPVHLITKEAITMYMSKLAPGGVLCIHTSNRHVELVPVVAKVSDAIHEAYRPQRNPVTGKYVDEPTEREMGEYDAELTKNWTAQEKEAGEKEGKKTWRKRWEEELKRRDVGKAQPLVARRGHDNAYGRGELHLKDHIGQYTSEWVLVARDRLDLEHLREPENYAALREEASKQRRRNTGQSLPSEAYWTTPTPRPDLQVWTDDYSNLLAVFRWPGIGGH
jgi:hypothetical protein